MRRPTILGLCAVLLTGCGSTSDTTGDEPAPDASIDASTTSYGADAVDWPNTAEGARAVFDALPATVGGQDKTVGTQGRRWYATYGRSDSTAVLVEVVQGGADPVNAFVAQVMYQPCDEASREGTVPLDGPAGTSVDNDLWFSCHLTGYSDQRDGAMDAQTLGWVSGDVMWWVMAEDRETVAELVAPMAAAAADLPGDGPGTPVVRAGQAAPYGIEDAAWPNSIAGVTGMGLPDVAGEQPRTDPAGGMLFVDWPGGEQLIVGKGREQMAAPAMLAFQFGLVYGCADDSFEGTAVGIPGTGGQVARAPSGSTPWFTCDVDGAEGEPHFRGHAAGWVSGDLAWLVVTSDEAATARLVRALVAATGR